MKMIYVGSLATTPDRDSNWINAFRTLGCEVIPFSSSAVSYSQSILGRISHRLHLGRKNKRLQQELIALAAREKPDWIHFRLPLEFGPRTIHHLKKQQITITQYMNDDPFSKQSPLWIYWKFHRAINHYDGHFVYRPKNVEQYKNAGVLTVEHCPPTYDPRRHTIAQRDLSNDYIADIAFIGHWENDGRHIFIESLAENDFHVIVKGGGWENVMSPSVQGLSLPITHAFGEEYNYIYANVLVGLCFFSKINNDSWTERALEIIAVGGLLVCERTDEAATYFKDREEAYFFSSIQELIDIVSELKKDPSKREQVRAAGYAKLLAGTHSINDRARQLIRCVHGIKKGQNNFV